MAATDEHLLATLQEINADSQPCVASIETKLLASEDTPYFKGLTWSDRRNFIYDGVKTECARRWVELLKTGAVTVYANH